MNIYLIHLHGHFLLTLNYHAVHNTLHVADYHSGSILNNLSNFMSCIISTITKRNLLKPPVRLSNLTPYHTRAQPYISHAV